MSVQADRERWVVRWRDGSGRQRGRRFESEASARAFDAGLREVAPRERRADGGQRAGGAYSYPTKRGTRWYFKVRDSSGRQTTRRGFTSEKAARDAKRRLVEQVERGEVAPNIDAVYPLEQTIDAHRRLAANEATGKLVVLPRNATA